MPIGAHRTNVLGSSGGVRSLTTKSIDFESGSTQSLNMSLANFNENGLANAATARSWSFWLKKESATAGYVHFDNDGSPAAYINFDTNRLNAFMYDGVSGYNRTTTATYTDTTAFHHYLIVWDSANATQADRFRVYVDGTRITAFDVETAVPLNTTVAYGGGIGIRIGASLDGLLYDSATFSTAVAVNDVYNGGTPPDIRGLAGLESLLNVDGDNVTGDYVLTAAWTNTNGVTSSTTIP